MKMFVSILKKRKKKKKRKELLSMKSEVFELHKEDGFRRNLVL